MVYASSRFSGSNFPRTLVPTFRICWKGWKAFVTVCALNPGALNLPSHNNHWWLGFTETFFVIVDPYTQVLSWFPFFIIISFVAKFNLQLHINLHYNIYIYKFGSIAGIYTGRYLDVVLCYRNPGCRSVLEYFKEFLYGSRRQGSKWCYSLKKSSPDLNVIIALHAAISLWCDCNPS